MDWRAGSKTERTAAHGGGQLRCFVSPEAAQSKRTIGTEQHDSVNLFGAVAVSGRIFGVTPPARRDAQKNFEKTLKLFKKNMGCFAI